MPIEPGRMAGPYEVLDSLGEGGMGAVFRARDTRLNRDVAIKFLKEGHEERFLREAHAMEYIQGHPAKEPLAPDKAIPIAIQIAEALEAAHRNGISIGT